MNKKEMRFIVSPCKKSCQWRHYLELEGFEAWTDCTEMSDADFYKFMTC